MIPQHDLYDETGLRESAGDRMFGRGRRYADQGQVTLLSVGSHGILAVAVGTLDYTVWLTDRDRTCQASVPARLSRAMACASI